ncbi:hypothetical protein C8J57DRAFT_1479926 [Mycena rebaudengoi]|nr:hypothetical protein C8J57DRAFT_1479926 [Mycena rebaudengoi]
MSHLPSLLRKMRAHLTVCIVVLIGYSCVGHEEEPQSKIWLFHASATVFRAVCLKSSVSMLLYDNLITELGVRFFSVALRDSSPSPAHGPNFRKPASQLSFISHQPPCLDGCQRPCASPSYLGGGLASWQYIFLSEVFPVDERPPSHGSQHRKVNEMVLKENDEALVEFTAQVLLSPMVLDLIDRFY